MPDRLGAINGCVVRLPVCLLNVLGGVAHSSPHQSPTTMQKPARDKRPEDTKVHSIVIHTCLFKPLFLSTR